MNKQLLLNKIKLRTEVNSLWRFNGRREPSREGTRNTELPLK